MSSELREKNIEKFFSPLDKHLMKFGLSIPPPFSNGVNFSMFFSQAKRAVFHISTGFLQNNNLSNIKKKLFKKILPNIFW
jgi:hypothetical protein